nr:acyltransferase [Prauserella isguenensis]
MDRTSRARPKPLEGDDKTRISFVDMGRAIAALLVVYSHIAHPWVQVKGENAPVIEFVETFSSEPMRMATQGIGQVAVPFFFLVSGFIVTPIAIRQGYRKFALNRFIRVYAPLLFVLLLTSAALWAGLEPQSTGQSQELTPWTMFTNWTLVNYILYPQVVLMPVAWTMIIEILFYLILLALLPVLRRAVWLAIGIELTFVFVVLSSRSELNESWSLFAVNVSYLPILIIGQIIWATTSKKIPLWAGGGLGALAWMLYVYADIIDVGRIDDSYNLAMSIAVMFFLMGYFAEPKLRQFRFWTAMSERSYSIYLLHGLGIFVTLGLLRPTVPFAIALPVSLLVTAALVEVSYRGVERPSHDLARRLSRRVGNGVGRGSGTGDASDGASGGAGVDESRREDADAGAGPPSADTAEPTVRLPADHGGAGRSERRRPSGPESLPSESLSSGPQSSESLSSGPQSPGPLSSEPLASRSLSEPAPVDPTRSQPPRPGRPGPPQSQAEGRRSEPARPEPPGTDRRFREPRPPRNGPRSAPEPSPDHHGRGADPHLNGRGGPGDHPDARPRPRPRPDGAEPVANRRPEPPPDGSPQPQRWHPQQAPGPGADPRWEQPRATRAPGSWPAERPDRPKEERNGSEHAGPGQAQQRPERMSQPRPPGPEPHPRPPRRPPRQSPEDPSDERRVPPRRPDGDDGPRHAR